MSSEIAMSGINAALIGLRTTANNIANASTSDFRPSRAEFSALVAGGEGRGVQVARIAQQNSSGEIDLTEQLLDMIKFAQQIKAQAAVIRTESENTKAIATLFAERDAS